MDASLLAQLETLKARADAGDLSVDEAAAMYGLVGKVRAQADYYERAVIRHLKYDQGLKWREVAERVGVDSRQGAHQRWHRLIGPPREVRR